MPALRVLAIEVGASHLAWARFRVPRRGRLALEALSFSPIPGAVAPEPAVLAGLKDAIGPLRGARGRRRLRCAIVLPGHWAMTKFIRTPAIARAQRAKIVAFEAQQNVPHPLSEVVWDHGVVEARGDELDVLLAAAKRSLVGDVCALAAAHGLTVTNVQPAALALLNAYRHSHPDGSSPVLLIGIGARSTHLVFIDGGRFFVRTVALGGTALTQRVADDLQLEFVQAEHLKLRVIAGGPEPAPDVRARGAVGEAAKGWVDRLRLEIVRSIAAQRRRGEPPPAMVYLSGGASILPDLRETLAASLQVPVVPFDVLRGLETTPATEAAYSEAHRLAELVGAAASLRPGAARAINLLPDTLGRAQEFRRRRKWWWASAALFATGLVLPGLHNQRTARAAEAGVREVERATLAMMGLRTRNETVAARLAAAQLEIDALGAAVAARYAWTEFLDDLQQRMVAAGDAWLDRLHVVRSRPAATAARSPAPLFTARSAHRAAPVEVSHSSSQLMVSGYLLDRTGATSTSSSEASGRVQRLLELVMDSPFVASVEQERFEVSQPGVLRFELVIMLDPSRPL